eukprot:scaffold17605_cov54-Phaeocystis_antarctica.AAC.3
MRASDRHEGTHREHLRGHVSRIEGGACGGSEARAVVPRQLHQLRLEDCHQRVEVGVGPLQAR